MGLPSEAGPGNGSERTSERGPWPGDLLGEHTQGGEFRATARRRGLESLARARQTPEGRRPLGVNRPRSECKA